MLGGSDGRDGMFKLMACLCVDCTFDTSVDKNFANARITINARSDVLRPVLNQLDWNFRIGQHFASHGHKIKLTLGNGLGSHLGFNASCRNDRNIQNTLDGGRIGHVGTWLLRNRCFRENDTAGERGIR